MKIFYVFRHGQTEMNLKKIWQGQSIDCSLNELGKRQAECLALKLQGKGIEKIYSSDLKRAFETAEIVSKKLDVEIIRCRELRESSLGFVEGKSKDEIEKDFPKLYDKWRSIEYDTFDFGFEGGETKRECAKRVLDKMMEIAEQSCCEKIGISSHGAVIRWLSLYFKVPVAFVENCAIVKIRFSDKFYYEGFI